jgi:hypothetical protein
LAGLLDVIALMDVLEHLSDPGTMAHCLRLLDRTACSHPDAPVREGTPYDEQTARRDHFSRS